MKVLGMISGTSHDAIDACLIDFRWSGSDLVGEVLAADALEYPPALRERIVAALPPGEIPMSEVCELDTLIGQAFADVAQAVVGEHDLDLICSHGQTLFHWVDGRRALGTLQLGQPAWIAERLGVPVISDVRAADIAAGGQGAPLVSILDVLLLGGRPGVVAALNLGGISNMTVLSPDRPAYAYDIGPANALIDAAVRAMTDGRVGYDAGGAIAASGRVDADLLADLLTEPYYRLEAPKSTGKELFHGGYLQQARARHEAANGELAAADLVATVTELTAVTVADALRRSQVTQVFASGGGVANPILLQRIERLAEGVEVSTIDDLGIDSAVKEAAAFALIGLLSAHDLPGNVPSCTGADGPVVLGTCTTSGASRLARETGARMPQRLELQTR